MLLSVFENHLRIEGLPPNGWNEVRIFVNGMRAYTVPFDAMDAGGMQLDLVELSTRLGMHATSQSLIQAYIIQSDNSIGDTARVENVYLPNGQSARRSAAEDCNRLIASAVHAPGDIHRWDFPLSVLAPEGDGDGVLLYVVCLRFALDGASFGSDPVAEVEWVLPMASDAPLVKRPRLAHRSCFGEMRCFTAIHAGCMQSVFVVATVPGDAPEDRHIRCEIRVSPSAIIPLCALRYVAYGVRSMGNQVPSLIRDMVPEIKTEAEAETRGKRLAVLVGVSKYTRRQQRRISDLEYADDDVVLWYHYLTERGYDCKIFGDEFSPYPKYNGPGTVRNVRAAVRQMVAEANSPEDHIVFITSSHGSGDGRGSSYLCLLPDPNVASASETERAGSYMDVEIAADLGGGGRNRSNTFVFLDACYSGGIIEELLDALPSVVGTTTCTRKGFGYDSEATHSGAWTNRFLTCGLGRVPPGEDVDVAAVFLKAQETYVQEYRQRGDRPCFFGRRPGTAPCNTELNDRTALPRNVFTLKRWM